MFDINYDPRLYMGIDIMSDNDGRVVFADGSWQDDVGFYRATNGRFTETNNEYRTYKSDEILAINQEISMRQKMSALAIKNNYFKYLNNGLEKYKVVEVKDETTSEDEETIEE